ncbi:MAG: glutamate-5-semialdehyde dehydrogenase [Planctomycetota bacterium]|nr:MAG: glutamate-5-semialdehyde dehydrogenase [Planctomycetota bacterium]
MGQMKNLAVKAKTASRALAIKTASQKNIVLKQMAKLLKNNASLIQKENKKDLINAKKNQLSGAMIDRLTLSDDRIKAMADGIIQIATLKDPVGEIIEQWEQPNKMRITKQRVPIGLVGIIFESRPNVTADAAALCLKSGNGCILRGGKEAFYSNSVIVKILQSALKDKTFDPNMISFVNKTDRALVKEMLRLEGIIDVIIPRGGKSLIKAVTEQSLIPVIKHYDGNCHIYVDKFADFKMALEICINAKTQRPGVCNAAETFLIHEGVAKKFLPLLGKELNAHKVEIRGCTQTKKILPKIKKASKDDWVMEYLDLIVAIKVVKDIDEAINHINNFGSGHSDCIVSKNKLAKNNFVERVDSAVVFANVSTRFNDGFEFGFGAEIGISTDRLHARGPVGLKELTTYKYVVEGNGQIKN